MPNDFYKNTENDLLVCIDMSEDFTTGCLGSDRAQALLQPMADFIQNFNGDRAFTLDIHPANYLETQEGQILPVEHGIKGKTGWGLHPVIQAVKRPEDMLFEKNTFGSDQLFEYIRQNRGKYKRIFLCGRCTGICVISNAVLIKTADPEATIYVLENLCDCVTTESHINAIKAMELLQMHIRHDWLVE